METRGSIAGGRLTNRQREGLNRLSLLISNLSEDRKKTFESEVLNMGKGTKTLILRLSEESHRTLKTIAAASGRTMTDIVVGWIEAHKAETLSVGQRILKASVKD